MNQRNLLRTLALAILVVAFLVPPQASALVEPFDPTNIMTDEEFNDAYSMRCNEIQAFLNDRPGVLKNYVDGILTAAQLVCKWAKSFAVNPRILLVLLQKEQGLLAEPSPQQSAFDWATGCLASGDDAEGLSNQLECAARTLRRRFDTVPLGDAVDGVVPVNRATLALYRYNNHQQGNNDFWRIWTKYWPGSVALPIPKEIVVDSQDVEATPPVKKDPCRTGWLVGTRGLGGHHLVTPNAAGTGDSTNAVVWRPAIPREGVYQVEVFIPNRDKMVWSCGGGNPTYDTSHARYAIAHRDGTTTYEVDQAPINDGWVNIGTYYFAAGSDGYVKLSDLTGEPSMSRYVSIDEARWTWVGPGN